MSVVFLVLCLTVVAAAALLLTTARWWFAGRRHGDSGGAPVLAARRHELLVSAAALLAAVACAAVLLAQPVTWRPGTPAPGLLQALVPCAVAVVFAVVRTVGELTWPRPRGGSRSAPLRRRTVRTLGGARLRLVGATAGCLVLALVGFGLTADPTGRAFTTGPVALVDGGSMSSTSGPYPGWPYGVPLLVALAVTLGATGLALATIVRRPPLHGVAAHHDEAVRATSAARLLGAVQLGLGTLLGGALATGGTAVHSGASNLFLNSAGSEFTDTTRAHGLLAVGTVLIVAGVVVVLASVVTGATAAVPREPRAPAVPAEGALA